MVKAVGWYIRREVLPRLWSILTSGGLLVALSLAVLLGYWGSYLIPVTTTVGALAVALLTYSAIALGFSLAGLTLALTLPNKQFVELLCATKPPKRKQDAYSDLLFLFSWNAIIHWAIVVGAVVLVLFVNPQQAAFEIERHRVKTGIMVGLSVYGLVQFLVTLITLSQVGSVYISHLKKQSSTSQVTPSNSTRA